MQSVIDRLDEAGLKIHDFKEMASDADKEITAAVEALEAMNLSEAGLKDALITDGMQQGEEEFRNLIDMAKQFGLITGDSAAEVEPLISVLRDLGVIAGETSEQMEGAAEETAKLGDLRDILESEDYDKVAQGYEKSLSAVSDGLKELRENGTISADTLADIQEQILELTDFTAEGLSQAGVDRLTQWIKTLRSGWETMSDEGKQQVNSYI